MDWCLMAFRRFADFGGRSQRKEYWMFLLFNFVVTVILAAVLGDGGDNGPPAVFLAYQLLILVPGLAVSVRRLHDIGKSGWWLLLNIVPLVGPPVLLYFAVKDSQPGSNQYGPNPKAVPVV